MASPKKASDINMTSLRSPLTDSFDVIFGSPQYTNWVDESLSWKEGCYVGDWTFLPDRRYRGKDALKLFADISVNTMENFKVGQSKHIIHCNPEGKIVHEGILSRTGEEELIGFGQNVLWSDFKMRSGSYEVVSEPIGLYKLHLQGPNALYLLEKVTGQRHRDARFMRGKTVQIAGNEVIALRQGMSGEIGFELQGPIEQRDAVRDALIDAGEEYGVKRMGGRVAMLNHLAANYPTVTFDYLPAIFDAWGVDYLANLDRELPDGFFDLFYRVAGSFETSDITDYYRSPVELGWANRINFDHDFIGADALMAEKANPRRSVVTLVWNSQDVQNVHGAFFRKDEPLPDFMEMPRERRGYMYADSVRLGGEEIGISTSRGYSAYFREMLSLAVLDIEHAQVGREVTVIWGNPGSNQVEIRATVAKAPYKEDRGRVDFKTLP